nr:DUF421 domain-containing protein [Thermohalobacter berrensis]
MLKKELKKVRMNIPLLISELRQKGYQKVADVEYAILEPNGELSVIPKAQARPVQPSDLAITPSPTVLSFPIIIDGKLNDENLKYLNKDKKWLMTQLKAFNVEKIEDVLLAQVDSTGQLYVDKRDKNVKLPYIY